MSFDSRPYPGKTQPAARQTVYPLAAIQLHPHMRKFRIRDAMTTIGNFNHYSPSLRVI